MSERPKVTLGEKIDSPKRQEGVEELCSKAMKNFLALIDLAKSKETYIIHSFKQAQAAIKIQHAWRKYITSHPQKEKQ